jgi:hypothetical protein
MEAVEEKQVKRGGRHLLAPLLAQLSIMNENAGVLLVA